MLKKDPLKSKRIFVGFNSAGAAGIYAFSRILKRRGYEIDFFGIKQTHFKMPVDFLLVFSSNSIKSLFQRILYFIKILPRYDIFHLNFAEAFFFYPLNLILLKLFGKKIVVTFRGIDVQTDLEFLPKRLYEKIPAQKWPLYYQMQFLGVNLAKKIRRKFFTFFADKVILTGPFLASSVSRFDKIIPYAREIKTLEKFKKNYQKVRVLHVPSDSVVKGTEIIEKSFKNLSKKYPKIDFKILQKIPREQLLQEIANADILIDQLLIGWYGGQAVEAMAMGKIVMAYLNPAYLGLVAFSRQIPIWNTNYWTIEQDLDNLLSVYDALKKDFSKKAIEFARKHHDDKKIAQEYLDVYRGTLDG